MRRIQRRDRTILGAVVASVVGVTGAALVIGSSCLGLVPSDTAQPTSNRTSAGGVPEEPTSTTELTSAESETVSTPRVIIPEVVDEAANAGVTTTPPQARQLFTAPPASPVTAATSPPAPQPSPPAPQPDPQVRNQGGLVTPLVVDPLRDNNTPPPVNTAQPPQQPVVDGGPNPFRADGTVFPPQVFFGIPPVDQPPPGAPPAAPQPTGGRLPSGQPPATPPPMGGQPPNAR